MAEVDIDTALEWRGRIVIDRDGEKVGTLKEIYLDEHERPHWGSIATGLFGTRETLAPLNQAQPAGDELQLPFAGDQIKDAPRVEPDVQLSADEEQRLYRHYELHDPTERAAPEDAMTRSEEEVTVGKQQRPRERSASRSTSSPTTSRSACPSSASRSSSSVNRPSHEHPFP